MNKIFKVIWSKSKQCYIVVSEMAKNHSGKKKIVVASILAAMAVGSGALVTDVSADPVRGGVSLAGGETKTDATIAIGSGSYSDGTAIGGDGSRRVEPGIAIGVNAKAMGNSNVVMGLGSQIIGHSFGVAIGRTAQATDDYGVSVGYNTHADLHGIAMGEQSRAKKTGATSFGVSSRGYGNGAIAVGWQSLAGANVYDEKGVPNDDINSDNGKTINDYDKWGDVAIGIRTIATGGNATALGRGATASAANAIAIGGGDGGEPTKSGNTASDNKEKTKATAEKAVAIGYKALASDKSATSIGTDAQASKARATAIGYEVRAVGKNAVAIGSSGENSNRKLNSAGENAISIGTAAQANNNESTAIGKEALASNTNAIALGTGAEGTGNTATAIGYLVKATESNAFAAGSESLASGKNSISIGSTFNNITNQSTGEASIAIGAAAQSKGAGSVALGRNVQALEKYTTAVGMNITASDNASASTILGYNSYTKANQSVNIGSTVKTEAGGQYSTAIGYTLSVSGKNAIGIGSSDDGIADDKKLMATGESSIAIGTRAQGKASGATAIGKEAVASHTDAIALGTSAQGTGEASTAIGNGAKATNSHAFAAGVGAQAIGSSAIAVGNSASALKDNGVAIGTNTTASEIETVAVGLRASAGGKRAVSVGIDTESTTADGVSVGYLSKSRALGAVAIGRNAVVTAEKSTAVGYDLSITNSGSTNIGYTSTVNANQAISVGARNLVEAGAGYGTALGYFVNISGKNAIGIGSSDDTKNVIASTKNAIAIGTSAQSHGTSGIALGDNAVVGVAEVKDTNGRVTTAAVDAKHGVAIGTNAKVLAGQGSVALGWSTEVNASDVVNSSTDPGATRVSPYLLDNIGEDNSNDKGNGIVAIGTKRTSGGSGFARRLTGVAGAIGDYDAVNLKQLKALESNEWLLRTQNAGDANPTDVAPQTVNNQTKKRVTLKAGDNIAISNSNGVVTLNVTNVVKTVTSGNTAALTVNNNNGAVTITPNVASSVGAANEDNKLVTSGKVKAALDDKIDKTAEMHIKSGEYTVNTDGTASLIQQNGNNQDQTTRVTIKDIAKKSVVDTLQSDYNTFKMKAITFTGDDNQGVARTLDTTLTVKGGANYTSTTPNTNIRVEKDAANGANGLLVKLSDKLSGMKEIAGTGSQDLVIKNGNTTVTVKAPANGDKGTVDFGDAKVIAKNLDASIAYKAGNGDTKKTVKLQDGFNFTAATDTAADTDVPKSGLAITTGTNGVVTFGLDKATREKVDNAADKNLSNLSDTGKDKVKELAKTAAQDAVKVANGINTTVEKDTATAGVTTYKVNANDTTVAVTGNGLAITGGDLGTDKVRKYSLDLSAATKGKLAAVGNLATNVIGGTTIAADGTVTGPTFSITKADGTAENAETIKEAIEKLDAANKGQNTKISDTAEKVTNLATALGGGAKVENGTFTGPTYNITKADGTGTETASNVGEAITKLDTRITTANGALVTKGLDFTGNDTTAKVHRDLGTTLTIKGAENFTRAATETNNIKVVKNGDALDVKLAENLAKMKEISGDGTSDLVIKNGDTKVTVKAPTNGDKGTVDFGDAKVVASNLDANIAYKANKETAKKTVKLQDGFNFTAATDTAADTDVPKSGLAITTGANGVVTFGLDKATRSTIDNAADKDLSNLSDTGKTTVKELAKGAAQDAVKVADGINTTVEKDTTTTAGVTTYKVNANDTTVAVTGDGLAITGGDLGTDKVRKYSLDLSAATKGKLAAVGNLATNVIGGTTIAADGTVTGPTFSITKADGTNETANTLKDAIDKLNTTNAGQNTKISETAGKVTTLEGKVNDIVDKGMTFAGDHATADKVTRKLGETLNIHGQNNITVKKDATAEDTLNVKLASELKNITSITNADADGKPGSKITLGANGVSIANTAAGADGAAGETKTVTIGKDGINAGGMKITNVGEAKDNGDAANKKYVDDAISNLGNIVSGNATLNFAGNVTKDAQDQATEKVGLSLATGTLHVNGANNEITTTAKGDTITVGLAETVKAQLAKVGDTASNGRDGKDGASGAKGLTGKDGLNDKTLTDKVNALRNGEAGSVVYTDENGARLVKAKDGEYYKATDVDATGNVLNGAKKATTVEARVVNPDGTTTGGTTKLSNIADGKVATGSKDAVNGGQLHTAKSEIGDIIGGTTINENGKITGPTFSITKADGTAENAGTIKEAIEKLDAANKGQNTKISDTADKVTKLATALGGGAKVENGTFTGPTYNITKADGSGTETASNVGEAITKLDTRITTANGALVTKGLDFTGNDTTDAGKVHRDLGTTLSIKGAENFTRAAAENNIKVVKNGDALDVKLAENLAKMKEISGDGASDLVIKNGDTKVTVKAPTNGDKGTVDFGDAKVIAKNLDTSIAYKSNQDTAKKTVKLQDGFNFTAATDTTTTAEGPKSGLAITTGDNGVVTFGLDKATRSTIDNAADKNLSNLSDAGKDKVKELAKGAAQDAVKVADGINTTVTTDTTTAGVTTYKVNANDTTVAVNADTLAISGGDLDATTKVRAYTLDLSNTVKAKLNAINNVGDTASNGRDGVNGASGAKGLTGKDGLNDKTLTDKVNALRNGEAGSVVYTDAEGNRVVKADDGKWYNAKAVDENGKLKSADQLPQGVTADEVKTPQARLVNPDGTTTGGTTVFNNVASAIPAAAADGAKPTFLDNLNTAAGDAKTKNVAVNVSDLNSTATEIIAKGLTFQGNDAQDIKKQLGETLHIVGEGTVPATTTTAANNIRTKKTTDGKLEIGLAKDLVGITSVTNATTTDGAGTKLALTGDSLTITNTQPLPEGAAPGTAPTVTTVTIGKDGINAGNKVISNVAAPTADKDAANKAYVDTQVGNAANKDLSNLNDAGINKVKDLAAAAVKVAAGKNTKVTADDSTPSTTTYVVDANDTVVTSTDTALAVTGGEVAGDNVRTYKLALSKATKDTLAKVDTLANTVGTIGADGRDGKAGTGKEATDATAVAGDKGLTGKDGLNGKDLTSKVNALRNGEAGTVVYTDENGNRLAKANDGQYYLATNVDKDGNVLNNAQPATTVQARLVNPDGSATTAEGAAGTKLSNIANGTIADKSKDAVNGGQLHTAKQELATALGGNATVTNGVLTGPTYEITKDDGTNGKDSVNNVGAAIDKLDTRINTVKGLAAQPLTFTGDDAKAVERALGTTLTVKGAKNFTPSATTPATEAGVNIRVEKDPTANANGLVVKLADTLTNMKGITGNGKDPLVIQNGDQSITITPTTAAETSPDGAVTKPAQVGKVDFGNSKITSSATPTETNDLVNKGYLEKAIENVNNVATGNASLGYKANTEDAKSVNVNTGLHFKSGTGTIDATGTGAATTNAATTKTGIAISTEENGVVNIGLDAATRKVIDSAAKLGNTATDGRDGKAGTGKDPKATDAVAGDKGLTGQDGLNGKDLTSKVNALRNGEAGTVVYTDDKGNRVVKANDGNYYKADDVKADGTVKTADENGGKAPEVVTAPQARLVNPDGTTTTADTATGTKLSNIANGTIADKSKDAVNGGQLHTAKQEMANALGGNAGVDANGALTQPTYSITKDDATGGTDTVNNVGAAVSKLDTRINTVKEMAAKPLTFTGDDAQDVTRALGTTLTVKGAKNFTPSATTPVTEAGVNIRVEKDTTTNANGLVVKLADTLTNMKGISGNGTDNLVIKNGTNTITVTPGKAEVKDDQGTVTTPADPGKVNFGDATVTVKNLEAPITYRANSVADDKAKSVSLKKGLDFVAGDGTAATATAAKAGLHIETGDDGKVIVGLSDDAKTKLDKVNDIAKAVGANGVDGRDGKAGTGKEAADATAVAGDKGLTGKDGLNGKDLTSKVNALRNGEAGTVVYTDDKGNRLVKANDGNYYPATAVDKDGNVLNNTPAATTVEAHLVNPDGTTVGGTTKLSNIADGEIKAGSKDAINGGQLHSKLAEKADKSDITTINNTLAGKANASDLNTLAEKTLTFSGDTGTDATRKLGETLAVKGAANFTPAATATAGVNIQVTSDPTNGLTVSLADTLTEMKGISGNGKDPLTIKNGDNAVITVKPGAAGAKGDVDFGGSKLTNVGTPGVGTDAANKNYVDTKVGEATAAAAGNAKLGYKANAETDVKQVAVGTGLHFKSGTGTIAPTDLAPNTESTTKDTDSKEAKTGIAITTEENGVVNIGLDEATRKVIDNAAKIGNTATDGRDGKAGTGKDPKAADAVAGDKGLTGKDGLNGKDLTSKVNALRNGEAGTVVYTDDQGNRLVKANDGKWYNAKAVTDKGELKSADQLPQGVTATPVDAPQARLVNPDGSTTTATKLSNIADGTIGENSKDAINGGQLHTALAGKANTSLDNLSNEGENKVKDLAAAAVKVAAGKNTKVTVDDSTPNTTTYVVDANDTIVTSTDTALTVTGGEVAGDNVRTYKLGLSQATKDTLAKVADIAKAVGADGANGIDGRDGKSGTGANAGMGKDGLTGADGLNGKDLTTKVNALRNGEAGTVVYTDDKGNRIVKASDGKWYPADKVKADGTKADDAVEVKTPQARLVNPDGSTTGGTTVINNVASAIPAAPKDNANSPFLDRLNTAAGDVNTKHAAVNVSDLNSTATEIIAKGLTFQGDDVKDVTRALGTTLTVKGAKNFTPSATTPATEAGVNIRVEKDSTTDANGLVVKLADTLTDMKGISGNGTDNLVIKNGTNTITVTPGKAADGATKADPGKVNFGDATVTVKDLDAPITYRTNGDADEKAKTVSLKQGLDFVTGDGTINTAESAKPGLNIVTGENGKVIIGLSDDAATKLGKVDGIAAKVDAVEKALDNKADKSTVEDLANKLADKADKATVKGLADKVDGKADKSTVADLAKTVDGKADKSELDKKADKGEVTALANKAMTFTGNKADETVDRKLGETLHLVGTNNITVEKDANKDDTLNVKLASTLTGMESITTKAVDGLSNTTWDPTKVASAEETKAKPDSDAAKERSKAATQGQLKDVADRVTKGRVFTADTKDGKDPLKAEVGLGDTLAIQGGATGELTDKNIGVELAPAKDGKPATMTVKLAKDLNMADGKSKYDRYLPEFEKDEKGLLKLQNGNPIPKKDKDGNVILQKDGNGNPIVNSSTVVDGNGTTYTINNLLGNGTVQVDNNNKPVAGVVTTTTATGTRYEERLTTEDGHVIFKQDNTTKELQPILKTVSVVDSRGIRIGSNDKPVVSLTKDGLNNGGNTISNVAPGVYESDAATVGQLNAATNTVTAKVNEAGAHAAALAAMNPLSYDPLKKSQVMAGVGAYKGNKALALGVAHYANEDTMFNVGVSVGGGSNMMNAGVTYRFGGEDSMIPERYKGGPISSVYILQDEVSALKAENAQVKADNEQVKADNARMKENYEKVMQDNEEMKAQIKMLMAHMGIK